MVYKGEIEKNKNQVKYRLQDDTNRHYNLQFHKSSINAKYFVQKMVSILTTHFFCSLDASTKIKIEEKHTMH